ncbi:CYFA0S05e05072g1_1 [Cyberlindnera fabianii]|uniref:CYFA0S05e05072g1_1 n=1 Tax=Cyberlindnera fabianii TaxID=36022 RepID=A0A061AZL7_CYBFA|nr:CYFA0S05e05072g1_1 [Cyberlindnera fabianii]
MFSRSLVRTSGVTAKVAVRSFSRLAPLRKSDNKLTGQQFDEAEMMSSRLTEQPYYAKRSTEAKTERDFDDFYQDSGEQGRRGWDQKNRSSSDDELKRYQRIEIIKGLLAGVFTIGGIVGGYALYTKWPALKIWWNGDGDIPFELPKKKKKKTGFELPLITNENDSSVPGLYVWGDNANYIASMNKKVDEVRNPIRHDWFDNKILKSVVMGETSAFAIDDKGDLIQWGKGYNNDAVPQYSVKGENITQARLSRGIIYALTKKHEILVIPESAENQKTLPGLQSRNWYFKKTMKPYTKLSTSNVLEKHEKITSIDAGKDHLVALSDKGRAFVTATGFDTPERSLGQYGLPEFSHFTKAPTPNELHEITLLNNLIQRTARGKIDHIEPRFITKVACGNHHTLALDSNGELYSFGQNTYGQLAHPVSYETEFVTLPKKVELFSKHVSRDMFPEVLDIHAGGDTSFATIKPAYMYQLIKGTADAKQRLNDFEAFTVGFGTNLKGQIGNNLFTHAQFDPVKIRELAKFEDYDTEKGEMVAIGISEWSSGQEHTFIKLQNKDVLYWGANDCAQLGNGKRNRIPKPTCPPAIVEPGFTAQTYKDMTFVNRLQLEENQHIVAGVNNSAIYYSSK